MLWSRVSTNLWKCFKCFNPHREKQPGPLMWADVTESSSCTLHSDSPPSTALLYPRALMELKQSFTCQCRCLCHDMMPSLKYYSGMSLTAFQAYQLWECVVCPFHWRCKLGNMRSDRENCRWMQIQAGGFVRCAGNTSNSFITWREGSKWRQITYFPASENKSTCRGPTH